MTLRLTVLCATLTLAAAAQRSPLDAAWDLVAKGKRGEAVSLLQRITKSEPRNADARLLLGSLLMEAGEKQESLAALGDAVRLAPRSAEAHNALGEALNAFGNAKAARPEFERAVELKPAFAQARVNLAAALLEAGDSDRARIQLDRALPLMGKNPEAAYPYYLRSKIYSEQRDFAKAAADLERAVAQRPDFAEAWSDLGEARKNLFDDPGAVEAYRRAVELSPDDAVARTRLGSKLLDSGDAHAAIPHLQHAVRIDPNNQSALNALQMALRKDGQREQSDMVKQRLAELLRNKDRADQNLVSAIELNNRGAALEKTGDLRGALDNYRAALEKYPEHIGVRTNLAIALLKLGRWKEGVAELREALRRDPGNELLQKALEDALGQARSHGIDVGGK